MKNEILLCPECGREYSYTKDWRRKKCICGAGLIPVTLKRPERQAHKVYKRWLEILDNQLKRMSKKDKEAFSRELYYWVGYLGRVIRSVFEKINRKPKWYKKLMKKTRGLPKAFVDHLKFIDGKLISEPYILSEDEIKVLIGFCKENNLTFYITGESLHFPGHTFRITIEPKKEREELPFIHLEESESEIKFKCKDCGETYSRPPLIGKCLKCGGELVFSRGN